jgi:hypothetical protein
MPRAGRIGPRAHDKGADCMVLMIILAYLGLATPLLLGLLRAATRGDRMAPVRACNNCWHRALPDGAPAAR